MRDGVWWSWAGWGMVASCPTHCRHLTLRYIDWRRGEQIIRGLRDDDEVDMGRHALRCAGTEAPHMLDVVWPHPYGAMRRDAEEAYLEQGSR